MATQNKIPIKQGEDLTLRLTIKEDSSGDTFDYSTGFTARMQIRQTEADTIPRDTLTTDDGLTSSNGRITLSDGAGGTANVVMTWTNAQATALDLFTGRGVQETYQGLGDLEIKDSAGSIISIRLVFEQTREVTL